MNFANVTDWIIPEGSVTQVTDSNGDIIWKKEQINPQTTYFFIEDVSGADNTLTIAHNTNAPNFTLYTSTNQSNWTNIGNTSSGNLTATVPANSKLYLRATASAWGSGTQFRANRIRLSGNYNVGGNIMTLLKASTSYTSLSSSGEWTFLELFENETKLLNANLLYLPTDTKRHCYHSMFKGCTNLRTAPTLPATTMTEDCYNGMFKGCTNLRTAPALPATDLTGGTSCYVNLFRNCTSLTTAPALPATTLATSCYLSMFNGCTGITVAPTLPATSLADSCYYGMFTNTGLTTAPALPAPYMAASCYKEMFENCANLVNAPILSSTSLNTECYLGMFRGCTSLTTAPALPATSLREKCYAYMFQNCSSLNSITTYASNISASSCLLNWMSGVSAHGDFWNLGSATYESGVNGIPSGWTEHNN